MPTSVVVAGSSSATERSQILIDIRRMICSSEGNGRMKRGRSRCFKGTGGDNKFDNKDRVD